MNEDEKVSVHIVGDFASGKGNCKYHCSPTCHPEQVGPEWQYGCLHKAWPPNRHGDFCPMVECDGERAKCELKGKKFVAPYKQGLAQRHNNAVKKVEKYKKLLEELNELLFIEV